MKKRLIFSLVIALVLIVAGVTAVGAYEGYKVNIKAHVETAIAVDREAWELGTVFPQQTYETTICYGLTDSFIAQYEGNWSTVNYSVYFIPKPVLAGTTVCKPVTIGNDDYYQSILPYLKLQPAGYAIPLDPATFQQTMYGTLVYSSSLFAPGNPCSSIHVIFNAPNFPGYFVPATDPIQGTPVLTEAEFCTAEETICDGGDCEFTTMVPYADLGSDMVIQVTGFGLDSPN
ncbi:MAG: hypothetical protein JW967_04525 [Dehalococcoidales bacterium]|nr:hypothetical protein [Dehalococcoidales bacterium]